MMRFLPLVAAAALVISTGATTPAEESVVVYGAEDAYVVADLADKDDAQGLRAKNFGGLDFIKTWYVSQVQGEEQVYSLGLAKFPLAQLKDREIKSAHLQLFALRADLTQPVRLVDVSLVEGPWAEGEVTFAGIPPLSTQPIATAGVYGAGVWYSWDVTGAVVRKANDGEAAFAVGLRNLENKKEEQVVFAAKEVGRNAPRLVVTYAAAPAPLVPPYVWGGGIGVAALAAFGLGIGLGRRRTAARKAAAPAPVAEPSVLDRLERSREPLPAR